MCGLAALSASEQRPIAGFEHQTLHHLDTLAYDGPRKRQDAVESSAARASREELRKV
jgi:hypothetical protein